MRPLRFQTLGNRCWRVWRRWQAPILCGALRGPSALADGVGCHWDTLYEALLLLRDDGCFELAMPGGYGPDSTFEIRFPRGT